MKEYKNNSQNNNFNSIFELFTKNYSQIEYFGKTLGKGAYGEVREVKLKNNVKIMAAKLVKKENDDILNDSEIAQDLRGNNIIKSFNIISREFNGEDYDLIIMEKAIFRDLGKLTEFYYKNNLLKLIIKDPFDEKIGDNLLRFYTKQVIDELETIDRNYFVHFDIKPKNVLRPHSALKKKVKDYNKIKISGGTQQNLTEEYFNKEKVIEEEARKQDYIALGSTLYYLKYGEHLLKNRNFEEFMINEENPERKLLNIKLPYVRSGQNKEKEFINFLTSLLHCDPEHNSSIEEIYRSKWLNANKDKLELIVNSNENDEEKIIMELQKSNYLINKEKTLQKPKQNFRFKKTKEKYNKIIYKRYNIKKYFYLIFLDK